MSRYLFLHVSLTFGCEAVQLNIRIFQYFRLYVVVDFIAVSELVCQFFYVNAKENYC